MPLSMTLNRTNRTPLVTPCFDGKELQIDFEVVSSGLSAISVKGCDAGDPRGEVGIRHRNSFWSVHRPELSKLNWASNHTPQNVETYLKVQAGNYNANEESKKSDILAADLNQLTVIHANSDQREDTDENYLLISEPRTTQLSDEDLASHATLHKSRAEFCVTIGHVGEQYISDTSEPSGSKIVSENSGGKNSSYENIPGKTMGSLSSDGKIATVFAQKEISPIETQKNEPSTVLSDSYDKRYENLDQRQRDGNLSNVSQEMIIALMDDMAKDRRVY